MLDFFNSREFCFLIGIFTGFLIDCCIRHGLPERPVVICSEAIEHDDTNES